MAYVTVEMQSTPVPGLTDAHLEAFAAALWKREDVKGPAASANLATGTLHVIASVDLEDVGRAVAVAAVAFRAALKAAGVTASVGETSAYLGEPGRTELLDGVGVAERLGVTKQRVYQLMADERFPRPATTLGGAHVWRWGDIADWQAIGGRRPAGRPPMTTLAIGLGLAISKPARNPNWSELRRRMIDRANELELDAVEFVKTNQKDLGVFHDGLNWVDQMDSRRGPGLAIGSPRGTGVTRTR